LIFSLATFESIAKLGLKVPKALVTDRILEARKGCAYLDQENRYYFDRTTTLIWGNPTGYDKNNSI